MALTVGVNSWVTRAEADAYFDDRIDSDPWTSLSVENKDKYLITAYNWIKFDPMFVAPAGSTSQAVKNGQCEAALFLINYSLEYERRGALIASGVKKFQYSRWTENLGEITKPYAVINYFTSAGYYNGGVSMTIIKDSFRI